MGFPIATARKEGGSLEDGIEKVNQGYESGACFVDPAADLLAQGHEMWSGGELWKDPNDAYRYPAREILATFQGGVARAMAI